MKTIKEIYKYFNIDSIDNRIIRHIAMHTSFIQDDTLFMAIDKGNNYIETAKKRKAKLILNDHEIPNLKDFINEFILWFYDYPDLDMTLIGVTGTNGKTTTAYFLYQLLSKSLLISNVEYEKNIYLTKNTTPTFLEIVYAILKAKTQKCKYIIMELSSIGIKEGRVKGLNFSYILLTNLTSDHLDYHLTLENYQNTKIDYLNNSCAKIILGNVDELIKSKLKRKYIEIETIQNVNYLSLYNQYNYSLAVLAYKTITKKKKSLRFIKKLKLPIGRCQILLKKPRVIIDYAHTETAFLEILKDERSKLKGKLLVLFGAGGNRDQEKRIKYGEWVLKYADIALVTNDNPRDENPNKIIKEIIAIDPHFFLIELDRKKAIYQILSIAKKEDTVLILGRGHERIQSIGGREIYLSDIEEVEKWIKEH